MNTYKYLISDCITTVYATRIECFNVARYINMKLMVSKVREYTGEVSEHIQLFDIRLHNYCLCYEDGVF